MPIHSPAFAPSFPTSIPTLFPRPRSPYFIVAPSVHARSAGVRLTHLLCHAINSVGERAYVVNIDNDIHYFRDNSLLTPLLTKEVMEGYKRSGAEPIAVYHDGTRGNPLGVARVVRYLKHWAGVFGGDTEFPDTDRIWCYSDGIAKSLNIPLSRVLFFLDADPDIFYPPPSTPSLTRSGTAYYARKHLEVFGGSLNPDFMGLKITQQMTKAEMASIFRRITKLYVYEETAVTHEALMCGCPVVWIRSPQFTGSHAIFNIGALASGISWHDSPVSLTPHPDPLSVYEGIQMRFWPRLMEFIEDTQRLDGVTDWDKRPEPVREHHISGRPKGRPGIIMPGETTCRNHAGGFNVGD